MANYYFSNAAAVAITLFAAAMWGSWMQVIKHRKDYPLSGIMFLVSCFSFVLVWVVTLILTPSLLPQGIIAASMENLDVIPSILIGGAMLSLGILINLYVMNSVGLLLSTAVSGALGSILGIITSIAQEGIPEELSSIALLVICTLVLIAASFVCNYSAVLKDRDITAAAGGAEKKKKKGSMTVQIILLLLLSTLLINGWSIGTATGTARGVSPILTCACMVTGALFSILPCGIMYFVKHQWKTVLCIGSSKKPLVLSLIASVGYYGGNLLSIYAMPVISATLSFLFGRTASVWTYFWGFYYKEFTGAKKRTYFILGIGIALYFIGILLLTLFNYN